MGGAMEEREQLKELKKLRKMYKKNVEASQKEFMRNYNQKVKSVYLLCKKSF